MGNGFLPQFGLHGNKKLVSCLATNNFYLFTIYFHNASKYYQQGAITYLGGGYGTLFPRPEAKIASFQQIIAKFKKKVKWPILPRWPILPHSTLLTQFSVVAFAPGKDFAIDGESHGVSSARMNRDLLDDELIERGKQLRSGDVVAMPKAQTTAGSFATSVHFTLVRHDQQTFAATFDGKG